MWWCKPCQRDSAGKTASQPSLQKEWISVDVAFRPIHGLWRLLNQIHSRIHQKHRNIRTFLYTQNILATCESHCLQTETAELHQNVSLEIGSTCDLENTYRSQATLKQIIRISFWEKSCLWKDSCIIKIDITDISERQVSFEEKPTCITFERMCVYVYIYLHIEAKIT